LIAGAAVVLSGAIAIALRGTPEEKPVVAPALEVAPVAAPAPALPPPPAPPPPLPAEVAPAAVAPSPPSSATVRRKRLKAATAVAAPAPAEKPASKPSSRGVLPSGSKEGYSDK
jgi:hypothetical protein